MILGEMKLFETYRLILPRPSGFLQTLVSHQPGSTTSPGSQCRQSSLHSDLPKYSLKKFIFQTLKNFFLISPVDEKLTYLPPAN